MSDGGFCEGDAVTWMHQPRGGYGYIIPVPARVRRVGPKRVQIDALRKDGTLARRWVDPENLSLRQAA